MYEYDLSKANFEGKTSSDFPLKIYFDLIIFLEKEISDKSERKDDVKTVISREELFTREYVHTL